MRSLEEVLGYLNFASATADVKVFAGLNRLFGALELSQKGSDPPTWQRLHERLRARLEQLQTESAAFRESRQASALVSIVFGELLPEYLRWHSDLLAHQAEQELCRPFFVGRALEAAISQGGPWTETSRVVQGALRQLNDYIGYRPVAILETEQKIQPYEHEWVATIPLYLRGAGPAVGRHAELIDRALSLLNDTSPAILFQAYFELERLDELSLDPRAYDFDHPVNKRPNYLYGQWDLGRLDTGGYARRFVVHPIALEGILDRVTTCSSLPREELVFEAAAVLACTMLMGSGVSANRPGAHDSSATLASIIQPIAMYRDEFYEHLLARIGGRHGERLRREAEQLRQPFGGVRQHFNQFITLRRAEQLQNINLALLYARIGAIEAAAQQVRTVPVAAARMSCDIECRMVAADEHLDAGRLEAAMAATKEAESLLHRAIHCGAMADPWNILGFGGQFSLFPALENSVHDFRIDELMETVGGLFDLLVQVRKEAAAAGNEAVEGQAAEQLEALAVWWDRFATVEVMGDDGISGRETCESAEHVSQALRAWHVAGASGGDLAFWRNRVEEFRSPKAYALVIDALLELGDPVAAMALLVQWLSRHDTVPLTEEGYAFYDLAIQWMEQLWRPAADGKEPAMPLPPEQRWALARKFLDYLEANADEYWTCPEFQLAEESDAAAAADLAEDGAFNAMDGEDEEEDEEDFGGLYSAAYENVTFRDSADDGIDSSLFDTGQAGSDEELIHESERLVQRLSFLSMLAQLWKQAAMGPAIDDAGNRDEELTRWLHRASANQRDLLRLLRTVHHHQIPTPRSTPDSLAEYERRLALKEMVLEQISGTCLETVDAARIIRVAMHVPPQVDARADWEQPMEQVLRAVVRNNPRGVRKAWRELTHSLRKHPLLFMAVTRGGDPARVIQSRGIQWMLLRLLGYLPRLGMLAEAAQLLQTAQRMEIDHPVGPGAITEFDHLFQAGLRGIVRALVDSATQWNPEMPEASDAPMVALLERLMESLMRLWFTHSRGLRLSPIEAMQDEKRWHEVKQFILDYGDELFTQRFLMNAGNLRAILHEGVQAYLETLAEEHGDDSDSRLIHDLDRIDRKSAARSLEVVLESVLEYYPEYIDYNNSTTQSDRGHMLYAFLDLLRVLGSYQRVSMNLQPVVTVHDELVRGGRITAAEAWQQAVAEQSAQLAEEHVRRFDQLSREHGMRLRSIADRLAERFVRPLAIDRLRAMVRPAIREHRDAVDTGAFAQLRAQIAPFAENLSGAGFEVPGWLEALEDEVDRVRNGNGDEDAAPSDVLPAIAPKRLTWDEAVRQVDRIGRETT
ncbi:MAG: hypothetical protein U1E05_15005 [Patescibacteria group bacterium]|nr:hypothetical protein [Patescibacteria group bacterium]